MARTFIRITALAALSLCAWRAGAAANSPRAVSAPPVAVVETLGLKPFYRKHVSAHGLPVLGSEKVSDYALLEAAYLIDRMLEGRDDVRAAIIKNKARFVVMAPTEMTTAVPEHSDLTPSKFWDKRARGLGATRARPATSCGDENLLGYTGDPYAGENILIHEFAHTIHQMGLNATDPPFQTRLRECYTRAMEKGLWKGLYAATNPGEYWAEGVQSWFDCNQRPNASHNEVNTREELIAYDPDLAALIEQSFPNKAWRYQRPDQRKEKGHMQGYDPAKAPRFMWDPELVKWYEEYQRQQQKK